MLTALHRWENSFAAFTVVVVLFISCMNTTNCSIFPNASCDRFAFSVPSSKNADATVGNAVNVFQAFRFPFQPKNETVSQSVTASKAGKALDLSSRWKVMVSKVTPYDVDLGPVSFLFRPSRCLRDKRRKQYPTVKHSEVVQKCKARRRCCCSPGKCLVSWGTAFVPNNIQPSNTLKSSKNVRQEDAVAVVLESV